eukprot:14308048-Ditylum_brightwellii.AAC.1
MNVGGSLFHGKPKAEDENIPIGHRRTQYVEGVPWVWGRRRKYGAGSCSIQRRDKGLLPQWL